MTATIEDTMEMDQLDLVASSAFEGYLVRKDLVRKYARQYPVPTYVVEFMLGRYCASTDPAEIAEGIEIVEKQLQGRTVRSGDEELFKSKARETGAVKLIARSQSGPGGWLYTPDSNGDEGSVTVTQIQALRACRNAGIRINRASNSF